MKESIELPVTTKHRRDMTDNVESDVKPEQTNKPISLAWDCLWMSIKLSLKSHVYYSNVRKTLNS